MQAFTFLDTLEYPLVKVLHRFGGGTFVDSLSQGISNVYFMMLFFIGVIIYLILKRKIIWKPLLFSLIVAIFFHALINEGVFKNLLVLFDIFRPRPYTLHPDILPIGHQFIDSSFPSSHMAFTMLMILILSYFYKSFLKFGLIIVFFMGFSRIHNGMHYPSDVIIGVLMGCIYAILALYIMKKFGIEKKPWWKNYLNH